MSYKTPDQWMQSWADFRKANLAIQKAKENKDSATCEKTQAQSNATDTTNKTV